MGALQLTPTRAGTIRRVIRRGTQYICGLCRSTYGRENVAQSCIQGCWTELLALDPVIVKRRWAGVAFRCRFCARDYAKREDAATCAEDCKAHQIALHEAEQSLTEQSLEPPPKKRLAKPAAKLRAVAAVAPSPKPLKKKKTTSHEAYPPNPISADAVSGESAKTSLRPSTEPAGVSPPTTGAASEGTAADAGGVGGNAGSMSNGRGGDGGTEMLHGIGTGAYGKKQEDQAVHGVGTGSYTKKGDDAGDGKAIDSSPKKLRTSEAFYRDGARYVCHGCHAKFFTRGEVEACFATHT